MAIICVLTLGTASTYAEITVALKSDGLRLSGLTPTGKVLIYGFGHMVENGDHVATKIHLLRDADVTGALAIDQTIAFQSVWFIVDLRSGSYTVATPPGYTPGHLNLPALRRAEAADWITAGRPTLHVCVARPGVGGWEGEAADGRETDADGHADGSATVAANALRSIGDNIPSPARLAPHDIVFVIEVSYMRCGVLQLSQPVGGTDAH